MAKIKEKHPHWFKLKVERRQLIRQLPSENAVNVLLACFDYLETGAMPATLSAFEKIAVSAFLPDLEEAWAKYTLFCQKVENKKCVCHIYYIIYKTIRPLFLLPRGGGVLDDGCLIDKQRKKPAAPLLPGAAITPHKKGLKHGTKTTDPHQGHPCQMSGLLL